MASSPTTSRQADGEKVETVTDFTFLGSKITAEGDCSHQIKRCLLLGRKAMTSLDSVLKSRHHFVNKVLYSQSYGFSSSHVWMCQTIKKAEHWDSFKLWCWRLFWESLGEQDQTSQPQRKSTLNIHWRHWCWSSNTLVTWCQELTHWKTLMLGKIEGRRGQQPLYTFDGTKLLLYMWYSIVDYIETVLIFEDIYWNIYDFNEKLSRLYFKIILWGGEEVEHKTNWLHLCW